MLRKPQPLRPGDTVAVVAPGGAFDVDRLEEGCRVLESWDLRVTRPRHGSTLRYLAGSDEDRAQELDEALADPEVRAVIAARGGFGCSRLFAKLRLKPPPGRPKIFVGYSDNTLLLTRLVQEARWMAFHGPMVASDLPILSPDAKERFRRFLFDDEHWWFGASTECWRGGRATGRLIGGCLSVLTTTLGTPYEVMTDEQVLFLEDVNEKPYRVERMLVQLRDAGKLSRVSAIVFGSMQDCGEQDAPEQLRGIVLDVLGHYDFPILFGFRAGHGTDNVVLPIGCRVSVDGAEQSLTLEESPFAERAG